MVVAGGATGGVSGGGISGGSAVAVRGTDKGGAGRDSIFRKGRGSTPGRGGPRLRQPRPSTAPCEALEDFNAIIDSGPLTYSQGRPDAPGGGGTTHSLHSLLTRGR